MKALMMMMIPRKTFHNNNIVVVATTTLQHHRLQWRKCHTSTANTLFLLSRQSWCWKWHCRNSSSVASIVVTAVDNDEAVDDSIGATLNHNDHPNTNHPLTTEPRLPALLSPLPLPHHPLNYHNNNDDHRTNRHSIRNDKLMSLSASSTASKTSSTMNTNHTNNNIHLSNGSHSHIQPNMNNTTTSNNTSTSTSPYMMDDDDDIRIADSTRMPPPSPSSSTILHTIPLDSEALRIPTHSPHQHSHTELQLQPSPQSSSTDVSEILSSYDQYLQERTSCHFGYPYNLQFNYQALTPLLHYSINNLGDPYISSNYGVHSRQFEVAVIDYLAQLWQMDDGGGRRRSSSSSTEPTTTNNNNNNNNTTVANDSDKDTDSRYWGYVTASGTEGNLHGILLARECFPDGILYTSQETHYSIFKAARYYRMECQIIPTLPNGEINYDILAATIRRQKNDPTQCEIPIIINVNIGTTVKGAIDNIDRIVQILQQENIPREKFYIHCDGALFALMIPFMKQEMMMNTEYSNNNTPIPVISFATQPIDSIAVSGHKMLGCPMPCGVALCRKEHITRLGQPIDYLNSIDTTIMGSRNGHAALYMWYALQTKGSRGIQEDVHHCIDTAQYLQQRLIHDVNVPCGLNAYSSTVVFERPVDVSFIQKWQLACSDDIAHVVVMPNITRSKIDQFIQEFILTIQTHGRIPPPTDLHSPLSQLQSKLW